MIQKKDLLIGDLILLKDNIVPQNCIIISTEEGTLKVNEPYNRSVMIEKDLILGEDMFLAKGTMLTKSSKQEIRAIVCSNMQMEIDSYIDQIKGISESDVWFFRVAVCIASMTMTISLFI